MSFNSLFCKIWLVAESLGVAGCRPRNFKELKCLVDRMLSTVSLRQYEQGALRELEQGGFLTFE
jgi:hypothetical protein